jgi:hypothetical protein
MIPAGLAWLGVVASLLWAVGLPLQLVGFLHGPVLQVMYALMAAYEIPLALWLIVRGAAMPTAQGMTVVLDPPPRTLAP